MEVSSDRQRGRLSASFSLRQMITEGALTYTVVGFSVSVAVESERQGLVHGAGSMSLWRGGGGEALPAGGGRLQQRWTDQTVTEPAEGRR